jgi:transcriptional regulator with GAF, ATPase, and Fis domain
MAATSVGNGGVSTNGLVDGRYRLIERLGGGAQGAVYLAEDLAGGGRCALKAVAVAGVEAARMLASEFRHLASLSHPSLVRVRDLGRATSGPIERGTVYFTADLVVGPPLLTAAAAVAPGDRAAWLWQVASDLAGALAVIHAGGLLHHDVAPQNLVWSTADGGRGVLLDLGLSAARRTLGGARGTLAYLAPEAIAGAAEARSDLYALGACLWHAARGAAPFAGATAGELARAILREPPAPLDELDGPMAALIDRLLAKDADARPASAAALEDELAALGATLGLDGPRRRRRAGTAARRVLAAPPVVGADRALAAIAAQLAEVGAGRARPVRLWGPVGAGAGPVIAEAIRRHQLAAIGDERPVATVTRGTLDELAPAGATDDLDGFARRLARHAAGRGGVVVIEAGDDGRADAVGKALGRIDAGATAIILIVTAAAAPGACAGLVDVEVGAVDAAAIARLAAAMIGRAPPPGWSQALHAASRGLPDLAADLVRVAAARADDPFATSPLEAATSAEVATAIAAEQRRQLDPAALAAIDALACWGGRADTAAIADTAGALAGDDVLAGLWRAVAAGVVTEVAGRWTIEPVMVAVARAAWPPARHAALIGAALVHARAHAPAIAIAPLALDAGPAVADRAALLIAGAQAALAAGRPAAATTWAVAARAATDDAALQDRAGVIAARAALVQGHYRAAIDAADAITGPGAAAARLIAARALQRLGALDAAEQVLAELYADAPADDELAGAYARLLVARARYGEAAAIAGEVTALTQRARRAPAPGLALRLEAAGLAALYQGGLDDADRGFAGLETMARADGDDAITARALALRGMVAQQRGELALAAELHGKAGDAARRAGEVHAAAVADVNRGTALAERGQFGAAAPVLAAAVAALTELGAQAELVGAEFNHGNALLGLGDTAGARAAAGRAVARATAAGAPVMAVFARLLDGDCARRDGDLAAARASYADAVGRARAIAAPHALFHALLNAAELASDADGARAALREAEALIAGAADRDRWQIAHGRVLGAWPGLAGDRAALGVAIAEVARRARGAGRLDLAWRGLAVSAALARSGDEPGVAVARTREAAAVLAEVTAAAPAFARAIAADPEAAPLAARADDARPAEASRPAVAAEVARLRRLLALSRRLNAELGLDRLLDEVIDAAIEMTAAERGFLLLRAPSGALDVVVARNFGHDALLADEPGDGGAVSRSIAERAATTGEPVITIDAGHDERFGAAVSVSALRLRSVMAVPLRQKGRLTGCVYVDHRLRDGAFDDGAAGLLLELADVAAIAIENARLADDLGRRTAEVEALNARLSEDLADRDAELVKVRASTGADRDRLRAAYPTLIGRSPALGAVLEIIERAAQVALPVVIVGESGTGKELVARALHEHGPRKDAAFVAVNCGAMPEALLETELFGHVRGAFTGADRDRRGLFEIADGGTLFLDEIAETGPAMQAKLLRVLQDGGFRRVGDDKLRTARVRVVAAAQRSLGDLVAAGRFRDDLRYRLEVITIAMPPLRARAEDLPLLIEHVLARIAPGRDAKLTRAAHAALAGHDWPGNVRELENALARAVALGGQVIDLPDLPDAIARPRRATGAATPATPDGDLRLRPALAITERAYITAAMDRSGGNQTAAARLLGLSRFGLQKKLRRLAGEPDADADADE